jgi:DNA gyrase subunit A
MAVKKKIKELENAADFSVVAKKILKVNLSEEMEQSFLSYAYYVIGDRAIPDARDGLKPVQRRIMYTMYRDGNSPDKGHTKSARIVGQVMGILHPHGDSSIYDAMVRLAQPYTMNLPLVDGKGNFGDRPGAGAAAPRYTEARMSKEALTLVSELKEKPVDFIPNYDQTTDQPVVLPVQFPNLVVNGTSGIAVGFATNMAPHNPGEVIDATRWLLTHPSADTEKLMSFMPGPDFPTGCLVLGTDGIKQAYETGKGKVTIRAPYRLEDVGRGKKAIIFYELPYEVRSERIIEQIKENLSTGKLQGIADVLDLTDRRNGTNFYVETKAGFNVDALVAALYKMTDLEVSFNYNNIALTPEGIPEQLSLKRMLEIFIAHRVEVVTRRSEARKKAREARLHTIAGLLKALANIDEVIRIVRAAANAQTAQENLIKKFKVDEIQADYILGIPLRRLTKYDQLELKNEQKKLQDEVKELDKILNDEKVLRALIGKELEETKKVVDRPRRSTLVDGNLAEHLEASKAVISAGSFEVTDAPAVVGVYADGSVVRVAGEKTSEIKAIGRTKVNPVIASLVTHTKGKIVLVTDKGRAFRVDVLHLGESKPTASSAVVAGLAKNERIIAVAPVEDETTKAGLGIFFATKQGSVKITTPDYPVRSDEFDLISLAAGDEIVTARWLESAEGVEVALLSSDTSLLTFAAEKIRPQGRSGGGIAGIKLAAGQHVLAAAALPADEAAFANVLTVTGQTVKLSPFKAYPAKGRATGGVRSHTMLKGENGLVSAFIGADIIGVDESGTKVALPPVNQKRDASGTKSTDVPVTFGR